MMLRKSFALVACGLMLSAAAQAAPLDKANVAKDAKWVVHVDLDKFADSKIAEKADDKWPEKTKKLRNWMENEFGITPQEDLQGLTMFSSSYERHSGVAILNAKFNRQKVKASLESKQGVQKSNWQDYTLYTYKVGKHDATDHHTTARESSDNDRQHEGRVHKSSDKPKTVTTAIVDRNTLVCAASAERVKQAIKLLENDAESLEKADNSKLVKDTSAETLIYASAIKLNEMPASEGPLGILRQHKHACYTLKERDGKLEEELVLTAVDKAVADKMKEAAEGLVSLLDVWTTDADKLNKMVEQTEIEQKGDTLRIAWEGSPGDALTAIEQLASHADKAKQKQRR